MPQQAQHDDAALIADLNDLLQLDHDAVQAYTAAIDVVRSDRYREALVQHRADHKRHIEELSALIRARGGLPTELPHPTAPLKLVVQALGAAPGDNTLLLAFKAVEGQVRDKYRRFAQNSYPDDVREVVRNAADDEVRHYQWAEESLRELGAGAGTLPHTVAAAVEGLHKFLTDPLEAAGRKVMEQIGAAVGTTRRRSGGVAPSPVAAASGVADRVVESTGDPEPDSSRFIAALRVMEDEGDLEAMIALYGDHAETTGPSDETPHVGRDGARRFWHMYRESFDEVRSTFTNIVDAGDGTVMLEWTSYGRARGGQEVRYAGVSVIEMQDGGIHRFRTYFNPRDLELGDPRTSPSPAGSVEASGLARSDADLSGANPT